MTGPRFIPTRAAATNRLWVFLATMPFPQVRMTFSLAAFAATTFKVIGWSWEPSLGWLGFLSLWGGLDVGQYIGKRVTDIEYVEAAKPAPITSTSTLTQPDGTVSETVTTPARPGEVG